jgi:uncharacterized membrane protein YidH (DUF202 family)
MEMSSSTLSQTLSGIFLDWDTQELIHPHALAKLSRRALGPLKRVMAATDNARASRALLGVFMAINVIQLVVVAVLRRLYRRQQKDPQVQRETYAPLAMSPVASPVAPIHSVMGSGDPRPHETLVGEGESEGDKMVIPDGGSAGTTLEEDDLQSKRQSPQQRRYVFLTVGYIMVVWIVFWATMMTDLLTNNDDL